MHTDQIPEFDTSECQRHRTTNCQRLASSTAKARWRRSERGSMKGQLFHRWTGQMRAVSHASDPHRKGGSCEQTSAFEPTTQILSVLALSLPLRPKHGATDGAEQAEVPQAHMHMTSQICSTSSPAGLFSLGHPLGLNPLRPADQQ